MHTLPPYLKEDTFPVSGMLARRGISLPTHVNLQDDDIDYVTERFLARLKPLRLR